MNTHYHHVSCMVGHLYRSDERLPIYNRIAFFNVIVHPSTAAQPGTHSFYYYTFLGTFMLYYLFDAPYFMAGSSYAFDSRYKGCLSE